MAPDPAPQHQADIVAMSQLAYHYAAAVDACDVAGFQGDRVLQKAYVQGDRPYGPAEAASRPAAAAAVQGQR
jgi:hypothetical protein